MDSKWRYKICISVFGHSRGTWVFSKFRGIQDYFPENFRCNLTYYEADKFSDFFFHHIFESDNFRIPLYLRKIALLGEWNVKNETSENRREFISMIRWASKIVHGWNGHLEAFCQVNRYFTENSRWMPRIVKNNNRSNRSTLFRYISLPLICMTTTWNVLKNLTGD